MDYPIDAPADSAPPIYRWRRTPHDIDQSGKTYPLSLGTYTVVGESLHLSTGQSHVVVKALSGPYEGKMLSITKFQWAHGFIQIVEPEEVVSVSASSAIEKALDITSKGNPH